jgi:tetratricopeptide (TPR) repeat protein
MGLSMFFFFLSGEIYAQNTYNRLCSQGFDYEQNGDIDGAIGKYTDAILTNPKLWDAFSYRAKANYRKQKFDEALKDISQAIELSPKTISLYGVRAECYIAKGQYEKAAEDYSMVILKTPSKDTQLYLQYSKRAQAYYKAGKYENAVYDINQVIKLAGVDSQTLADSYSLRADCNFKLSKYSESVKDYDLFLQKKPDNYQSLFYQGMSYLKLGNSEKAKTNASRIIEIDPSKEINFSGDHLVELYDLESRNKIVNQSLEEANSDLEEVKNITSKSLGDIKLTDAFQKMNNAWLHASDLTNEDKDLSNKIRDNLCVIYSKLKDKPEIPETARKYMVQANSATTEKKYADAIKLWNKVLSIAPYYSVAYFNEALLYEFQADYRSSIANMNKYLELYPDAPDARAAKDKIYEWEGKVKSQPENHVTVVPNQMINSNPNAKKGPLGPQKPEFFIRGGLSVPKGNSAIAQNVAGTYLAATQDAWNTLLIKDGYLGLEKGYFVEAGLDLDLVGSQKKVFFYYNPISLAYFQNSFNWNGFNGFNENNSTYKKPFGGFEIAQRYGIGYKPVPKLVAAAYYRPAFLFPFGFDLSQKTGTSTLQISSVMGTKKVLTISNTFGFSLRYSFIELSYELFSVKAGYDVTVKYTGSPDKVYQNRVPMKANRIGITLIF